MKCKRCNTYDVVLKADKDQPSVRCTIAPQSDSEAEHWASIPRWVYAHPNVETDFCYYCEKVEAKRITKPTDCGIMYEAKQEPRFAVV